MKERNRKIKPADSSLQGRPGTDTSKTVKGSGIEVYSSKGTVEIAYLLGLWTRDWTKQKRNIHWRQGLNKLKDNFFLELKYYSD